VTVVSLPARGWPPQAAARWAGLEFVEKLLTRSSPVRTRRCGTLACFAARMVASLVGLASAPDGPSLSRCDAEQPGWQMPVVREELNRPR
jgi:hypothetical protein